MACSFNKARNSHRIIYDYGWDSHSPCTCTNSCCPAECNRYSKEDNASSIFHIFERLNTGGTPLKPQEIRNCVYWGPIVQKLRHINEHPTWKDILGLKRMTCISATLNLS